MKKKKSVNIPDENEILNFMRSQRKPLRASAIMEMMRLPFSAKKSVEDSLHNLAALHQIEKMPGGFWCLGGRSRCLTGKFFANINGGGKVIIENPPDSQHSEIYISPFQTAGAWHNDLVRVNVLPGSGSKGKIIEIIKRDSEEIPAIFEYRTKNALFFHAADGKIPHKFVVYPENINDFTLTSGDALILRPLKRIKNDSHNSELWKCEIISYIGESNRIAAQEAIVKLSQNVPGKFPDLAIAQAQALPPAPLEGELADREDLRSIPFVTIDGANARDFDDAVHVQKIDSGWILRVAIADVSHYVQPDETPDSLDACALARGNSWYFPRSVEPMLPKALSNGLCSLRPNEDRLAMLAEIEFDKNANPVKSRFASAVINSQARLIYEDVSDFFKGDLKANVPDTIRPMLMDAYSLYDALAKKRRKQGTLDFILPEAAYDFDEDGKLINMHVAERGDANMLIEEFMIAANEAVAEFLGKKNVPFLYRVHPSPDPEKLNQLYATLAKIAPQILPANLYDDDGKPNPHAIQPILAAVRGTPEEYVVNRLCLRAMAQARYEPDNKGHFGLASKDYCHFTSPIRRYADLLVHRALKNTLDGKKCGPDKEELEQIGEQLNTLERKSIECEREITKRLGCLALENNTGEVLSGTVSGVADFGVFVEFDDLPVEGLMRSESLGDDWFSVDQSTQRLVGARTGKSWQLGQPVKVRLESVNLDRQEIRLTPVEPPALAARKHKFPKKRQKPDYNKPDKWNRKEARAKRRR